MAEHTPASSQPLESSHATPKPPPLPPYSWQDKHPNCRLVYIRDHQQADQECSKITGGSLGFDLEWKPNYVRGQEENRVSLVQIANSECILLLQVSAMSRFPEKLQALLGNPSIVKAGAGIQQDCKKLYRDHAVILRNCVDLSCLARSADNAQWKGRYTNPIGLARLVAAYEQLDLPGKGKIQRSNWERVLTAEQQQYAANDAHCGYVVYTKLTAMAELVEPKPLRVYYSFDVNAGSLVDVAGAPWVAMNPNYDPGPPPPPREKKDKERIPRKPRTEGEIAVGSEERQAPPDAAGRQRPPRRRRRPDEAGPTASSVAVVHGAVTTDGIGAQTVSVEDGRGRGGGRGRGRGRWGRGGFRGSDRGQTPGNTGRQNNTRADHAG